jgi:WD40 repeat protein
MKHIAILGTEGSGKTVLATVWARKLAHSVNDKLYLVSQNITTEKYVEQAWRALSKGQWVPSTPQGEKFELEWVLHFGSSEHLIKLIDLPGQDLRNFFNGEYSSLSTDSRKLCDYISSASIIFVVVNLELIRNDPEKEDCIVLSEIVRFLSEKPEMQQHLYFVFTAWDKVAATVLDQHGSLTECIRKELTPLYRTCEHAFKQEEKGYYFLAVAPVAQIVYDVRGKKFYPKRGFKSYNLGNFSEALVRSLESLEQGKKRPTWEWLAPRVHPPDKLLLNEWRNRGKKLWQRNPVLVATMLLVTIAALWGFVFFGNVKPTQTNGTPGTTTSSDGADVSAKDNGKTPLEIDAAGRETGMSGGVPPLTLPPHSDNDEESTITPPPFVSSGLVCELTGHTNENIDVHFSSEGKRIVTTNGGIIRIWDAESGSEIQKIDEMFHSFPTSGVLLTMKKLGGGTTLRRWDTETGGEKLPALEMPVVGNHQAHYSPDRKKIAVHDGRRVFIWDVESGMKLYEFAGSLGSYSFSPDGQKITVSDYDGTDSPPTEITRIWNTESGRELLRMEGGTLILSPDSKRIATGGGDRDDTTRIWDANSYQQLQRFDGLPSHFFPDGRKIVTYRAQGDGDTTYRILDVETGRELRKFEEKSEGRLSFFSPDDKKFLTVSSVIDETMTITGCTFRIWDSGTCGELQVLIAKGCVGYFSSDSRKFVTYGFEQQGIQIWDVESGKELYFLEGFTSYPRQNTITKVGTSTGNPTTDTDGKVTNFRMRSGTARIWDIDSGKELQRFEGEFLGFSPDEKRIATVSEDGTVRIWTVE